MAVVPVWIPASCPAGVYHKVILHPRSLNNRSEDCLCRGASADVPCADWHGLTLTCLLTWLLRGACMAGREECPHLSRQTAHAPYPCSSVPAEDAARLGPASVECPSISSEASVSTYLLSCRHELCRSSGPCSAGMPLERLYCPQWLCERPTCSQGLFMPTCAERGPALGRMAALAQFQQSCRKGHETCGTIAKVRRGTSDAFLQP